LTETINGILEKVSKLAKTWPAEKIEDMKFLANHGFSQGWYLNEVLIFGLHRSITEHDDFNDAVIELIDESWDFYWKHLIKYKPARKELFLEIKQCHESELFGAAIHLCFSQADGLFYDKFGVSLYSRGFNVAKTKFGSEINDFISRDSIDVLSEHYKDGSLLRRMFNEVYSEVLSKTGGDLVKQTGNIAEEELKLPNRHGVLHGIHTNYASKLNSYKAIAFLVFILFSLNGEKIFES
jgi:hypothetical protein